MEFNTIQIISDIEDKYFINSLKKVGLKIKSSSFSNYLQDKRIVFGQEIILFIIPIMGDNDLLPYQVQKFKNFIKNNNLIGYKLIVILKGDRHMSDQLVLKNYPIHIKLSNIFSTFNDFHILDIKLDKNTVSRLSVKVSKLVEHKFLEYCKELDSIGRLLNKKPKWNAKLQELDFYNETSGYSLLKNLPQSEYYTLVNIIRILKPVTLKLNHAHLSKIDFNNFSDLNSVLNLELNSNTLTMNQVLSSFPKCRHISLGANYMKTFSLERAEETLESIYVYKNSIKELIINPYLPCKLKKISLYRNEICCFEYSADQNKLEKLNLGANPLTKLPDTLSEAKNLTSLGLARTNITSLPEWIFNLPSLKEVDISYIEDKLPLNQLKKLSELNIEMITKPI